MRWIIIIILSICLIDSNKDHQIEIISINNANAITIDSMQSKIDSLQNVIDWLTAPMSMESIEYWIDTLGIEHKEIVMDQIRLETGNLSSEICTENYNLFGMKEPRVRETTALGTKRGHAYYRSYIDSIKDYKLWQDSMYEGGDYYAFLSDVGYAEDELYINSLKSI